MDIALNYCYEHLNVIISIIFYYFRLYFISISDHISPIMIKHLDLKVFMFLCCTIFIVFISDDFIRKCRVTKKAL